LAKTWSIKNLYFYLVCLATLFIVVGGFITTVNSAAEILLPNKPNVPLIYVYYRGDPAVPEQKTPSLSELEKMRAEQERMDHYYNSWAMRRLLNAIALMIIPIPFYLYHWKQVKPKLGRDK